MEEKIRAFLEKVEEIREEAKPLVEERWAEFVELGQNGTNEELFSELSFCVLTANWSANGGIKAQKKIGSGFAYLSEEELSQKLREVGHRYPEARAKYIVQNRWIVEKIRVVLKMDDVREYLVDNIKGIAWKESSHFLRNIGFPDFAILDKHVLSMMNSFGLIDELPKSLNKKKYLMYENTLRNVAEKFGEPLGKFDLYIWYSIKGKVEK